MGIIQRDSLRITILSYAGALIGYLNKVFLFTNFLTSDQVGLANLLITLALIYAQFAALGSYNITLRFFPFFNNQGRGHGGFLTALSGLVMAGFILLTALLLVFRKPFVWYYQESSPMLVEYALYLIPLGLAGTFFHLFEAYLRSLQKNLVPTITHEIILRILITLSVSAYALKLVSFEGFLLIYVIANCLPALILLVYTASIGQLGFASPMSPLMKRLGKIIIVYGLYSFLNNISSLIFTTVDSIMVAGMINLHAVGVYTTMIFVTSVVMIPYRSMVKVSGPIVASYWKNRDMEGMRRLYQKATASNLVVGGWLFLMLWANIDALFMLIPGEYAAGRYVFLMLGLAKLFDMVCGLNGTILLTSGKYRYDLLFTIGLVVLSVITNLLFIPWLGINGAALASMLTLTTFNLLRILFIRFHYHLHPFERKQLPAGLLIAMLAVGLHLFPFPGSLFGSLMLRSFVTTLLFLVPVYLLDISPELNELCRKMLLRLKRNT